MLGFNSRQKTLPRGFWTSVQEKILAPWASQVPHPTLPRVVGVTPRRRRHRRTTMIPPTTSMIRSYRQYSWRTHFPTRFIPLLSSRTTTMTTRVVVVVTVNVPYYCVQSTMFRYCITPLTFYRGMVLRNYLSLLPWGRRHWRNISVVMRRVVFVVG